MAGIDPLTWIRTDDEIELEYMQLVAGEAIKIMSMYREDLANRIVHQVNRMFGGK